MEVVSTFSMISINATLVAQLLSFLIFLLIMNRMMFQPLRETMQEREQQVERIQQEIEAERGKMETVLEKLAVDEARVKHEALEAQYQLEQEGQLEAKQVFNEGLRKIERLKDETRKSVQLQIQEARKQLAQESQKLVRVIIDQVLDRRVAREQ